MNGQDVGEGGRGQAPVEPEATVVTVQVDEAIRVYQGESLEKMQRWMGKEEGKIQYEKSAVISESAKNSLSAIKQVHSISKPEWDISISAESGKSRLGSYRSPIGGKAAIGVKPGRNRAQITTVHEIGHAIDDIIGAGKSAVESDNATVGPIMDAINKIRNITTLSRRFGTGEIADEAWARYALSDIEKFARGYAQYIAVESGDSVLLSQLAKNVYGGIYQEQWDADDFAPIQRAFSAMFRSIGWKK